MVPLILACIKLVVYSTIQCSSLQRPIVKNTPFVCTHTHYEHISSIVDDIYSPYLAVGSNLNHRRGIPSLSNRNQAVSLELLSLNPPCDVSCFLPTSNAVPKDTTSLPCLRTPDPALTPRYLPYDSPSAYPHTPFPFPPPSSTQPKPPMAASILIHQLSSTSSSVEYQYTAIRTQRVSTGQTTSAIEKQGSEAEHTPN